ncbi:porin [Paraburkholderia susongensis]|uniref:Outer membrane protein (Porin) n=1 Tax=Paraburkholderia susongensis TaxID=1515439 RepID=A0A1X7KSE5_9BURK|nr:porin [Paraburkholderia susongensis]SMG44386.1 Outer membrane protein (porin) [Paraburkholderia susongensis]
MKKTLTGLCILCAGAGMVTNACAQSSVTLYGIIDTAIEYSNVGSGNAVKMDSGVINGSRFGFKGTEDLGGGLSVIFTLESGFAVNNGTLGYGGLLFGRQAWIGFHSDSLGQLSFGRHYTVLHTLLANYTDGLAWGNASSYFRDANVLRANNSIRYVSPTIDGFTLGALYAMSPAGSTTTGGVPAGNIRNIALNYSIGQFSAAATYMASQTAPSNTDKYAVFGLSYDFGITKLSGVYYIRRDQLPAATSQSMNFFEVLSVTPIGLTSVMLSYGAEQGHARPDSNAQAWSIRYNYPLSKTTFLYTGFTQIFNQKNAAFTINTASASGTIAGPGKNPRMLMVGINHAF